MCAFLARPSSFPPGICGEAKVRRGPTGRCGTIPPGCRKKGWVMACSRLPSPNSGLGAVVEGWGQLEFVLPSSFSGCFRQLSASTGHTCIGAPTGLDMRVCTHVSTVWAFPLCSDCRAPLLSVPTVRRASAPSSKGSGTAPSPIRPRSGSSEHLSRGRLWFQVLPDRNKKTNPVQQSSAGKA
uniref:Uncharacterized protein n=1 Tax=Molossus molossus TaxID=27622 RepID=A0A7J8I1U3_MOLMO|nr:hypothetical protein HJG59_010817 [Molossus molossus]